MEILSNGHEMGLFLSALVGSICSFYSDRCRSVISCCFRIFCYMAVGFYLGHFLIEFYDVGIRYHYPLVAALAYMGSGILNLLDWIEKTILTDPNSILKKYLLKLFRKQR